VSGDTVPGGDGSAPAPLTALGRLQDADAAIDQLRHRWSRLAERTTLAGLETKLAENNAAAVALDAARCEAEARLAELASEVDELVVRTARIDGHLRAGEVASFRDQEAMATEIGSLDRRRSELDDKQLVVMEAIEELERQLGVLVGERGALTREISSVRAALSTSKAAVDTEIATIAILRAELAAAVPSDLLDEYEHLRARLDGVAVSRLVNGSCSGCHLAVAAAELDHLRHAPRDEVVHCAQCGRILVA
jgi:predicted  nucleic acid-binding Zn-ribbon protein